MLFHKIRYQTSAISKFVWYFLSGFFLCLTANAQIETYQLSLKDSTKNILYRGIENRLEIRNLPFGAVLSLSSGTIEYHKEREYIVTTGTFGKDTLYVKHKGKVIFKSVFDVNRACSPEPRIGDVKGDKATVAQIISNPKISFGMECQLKFPSYTVVSFSVTLCFDGKVWQPVNVNGNMIAPEILEQMKKMRSKDVFYIDDIKVLGPDSRIRQVATMRILIQ